MSPLGTWIAAHKGDPVRATFWLVKLGLASPVYLTDCDQPIIYDGHVFDPDPLTVEGIQADGASTSGSGGRLTLATGGPYWPGLVAAIAGGNRNPEVTFWEAWLDIEAWPSPVPAGVRLVALTRVEAAEWDQGAITFTLGPSSDPALGRIPFREYSPTICTYREYKGPQCGSTSAEPTCARTPAACDAKGNLARFGGFGSFVLDGRVLVWNWSSGENLYTESLTVSMREP